MLDLLEGTMSVSSMAPSLEHFKDYFVMILYNMLSVEPKPCLCESLINKCKIHLSLLTI